MFRRLREHFAKPAGNYFRCSACQRLRDVSFWGRWGGRCKCGEAKHREPNAVYWHERLRIFLRII